MIPILDSKRSLIGVTHFFFFVLFTYIIVFIIGYVSKPQVSCDEPVISPLAVETATPTPTKAIRKWNGKASYYSRSGCLGCSPTLTMANGETLDDARLTLAMTPETVRTHHLLNKNVTVRNVQTDVQVVARVTDTGGFGRYDRIADLTVATKEAIGCSDVCDVEITAD